MAKRLQFVCGMRSNSINNTFMAIVALVGILVVTLAPTLVLAKSAMNSFDSIQVQTLFDENQVTAHDPESIDFVKLEDWEGIEHGSPLDPNRLRTRSFEIDLKSKTTSSSASRLNSKRSTKKDDGQPSDSDKREKPDDCIKCNLNQSSLSHQAENLGDIRNALNAQYEREQSSERSPSQSSDELNYTPIRPAPSNVSGFQRRLIEAARKEAQQRCRVGSDGTICKDGSKGMCLQAVREAVQSSAGEPNGRWTTHARDAGPHLHKYGLTNAIDRYPNAAQVPTGAVLIYAGGPSGHIEVFTGDNYCSDYCSSRPRSDSGTRRLIGVYVPK